MKDEKYIKKRINHFKRKKKLVENHQTKSRYNMIINELNLIIES